MGHDEHAVGAGFSLLVNSLRSRAFAACLLEFKDEMSKPGVDLWKKIFVDYGGEFNRNPRNDGSGSDHAFTGKSVSLYSGAIANGPIVLGNLAKGSTTGEHMGTWGAGAPVSQLGQTMGLNHMAATIAHLLDVKSPVTSAASVVNLSSEGIITPAIELTKIV